MSGIKHGRRKGSVRGAAQTDFSLPTEIPLGMQLADGTDLRQVTVLGRGDWERIQAQLNKRQIEEARIQKLKEEREQMKLKSKELVKNWGNTIIGSRQRKLEARKLREQKEEEEKCQIDIEEAKFQAEQRKEAIEKARTQQYYQTDRVKGFHGALLLTEVLKEREAQVELKQLRKLASAGRDKEWLEKSRYQYEASIQEDQNNAAERIRKAQENAAFQAAQIRQHLKEANELHENERNEGDQLKKLAFQYNTEKERLENMRREERRRMMEDNRQQIVDIKRMKEIQKQQEEEENEECRLFADAKRKMMVLRAEKEEALQKEKQATLEAIREKLGAQMKQKIDDEDDRIGKATEEIESKKAREDREKEEKMQRLIAEAAAHRQEQMKKLEDRKKRERMEELEMIQIRQEADLIFQKNEEEKMRRRREEAQKLSSFHGEQAESRRLKAEAERNHQLALDQKNIDLLAIEEQQFQEYANKVIEHCAKGGRNIYPLKKAAKEGAGGGNGPIFLGKGGLRPSYMVCDNTGKQLPSFHGDSTEETKRAIYGKSHSKQRLGFVW